MTSPGIGHIPVARILRGSLDCESRLEAEGLDLGQDGPRVKGSSTLAARCYAVDREVIAEARIETRRVFSCARCLDEWEEPYEKSFVISLEIPDEKYLDLLPFFREELILNQPIRTLCRPDCRGLCGSCGLNLNENACACGGPDPGDPEAGAREKGD